MLTAEHEAVDLSLLLNNGAMGLCQTVLRLAGQALRGSRHNVCGLVTVWVSLSLASAYRPEEEEDDESYMVGMAGSTQQVHMSGQEILSRLKVGTRVVRGQDWKWEDQVSHMITSELSSQFISFSLLFTPSFPTSLSAPSLPLSFPPPLPPFPFFPPLPPLLPSPLFFLFPPPLPPSPRMARVRAQ